MIKRDILGMKTEKERIESGELVRCVVCYASKVPRDFSIGTDICEWCQGGKERR